SSLDFLHLLSFPTRRSSDLLVSALGAQFIIEHNLPGLVFRGPTAIPGELGPVTLVLDPSKNLAGAVFEGLDYEAIYILDSAIFGDRKSTRLNSSHQIISYAA